MVSCALCGGREPSDTAGWTSDGVSWWDPGCGQLERAATWTVAGSIFYDVAAARYLIRCCDEIDRLYQELPNDEARAQAEGPRARIRVVGEDLESQKGESGMRRVLELVAVDGDQARLMGLNIVGPGGGRMSFGTPITAEREAAVRSHLRFIDRDWTGVGSWVG